MSMNITLCFTMFLILLVEWSLQSDFVIEEYKREIDDYIIFSRVIDTVKIQSIKEKGTISGTHIKYLSGEVIRYYDDLGTVHTKAPYKSYILLKYRYPLHYNEKISFTLERLRIRRDSPEALFDDSIVATAVEEKRMFPFIFSSVRKGVNVRINDFFAKNIADIETTRKFDIKGLLIPILLVFISTKIAC